MGAAQQVLISDRAHAQCEDRAVQRTFEALRRLAGRELKRGGRGDRRRLWRRQDHRLRRRHVVRAAAVAGQTEALTGLAVPDGDIIARVGGALDGVNAPTTVAVGGIFLELVTAGQHPDAIAGVAARGVAAEHVG